MDGAPSGPGDFAGEPHTRESHGHGDFGPELPGSRSLDTFTDLYHYLTNQTDNDPNILMRILGHTQWGTPYEHHIHDYVARRAADTGTNVGDISRFLDRVIEDVQAVPNEKHLKSNKVAKRYSAAHGRWTGKVYNSKYWRKPYKKWFHY